MEDRPVQDRPVVLFKKLYPDAKIPSYSKAGDAGMDVYSLIDVDVLPGETVSVATGISMAIPEGYFGSARERSGLALKGIRLGGGVIDSGYRGEIRGIITNLGPEPIKLLRHDRIFQIIIQPCASALAREVDELPSSERGADGFGSTGR